MTTPSNARTVSHTPPPSSSLSRLFRRLATAVALGRQRARLSDLDPHILRDIGLSADEAEAEARRSVWDVPPNWRR